MELQIAENDLGAYYSLGPITVGDGVFSVSASGQYEEPLGDWNSLDVFALGSESVQVVNGHQVVHVTKASLHDGDGGAVPLTRGKIQLQSESMEIFFRAVTVTPITQIPPALSIAPARDVPRR
jgi:hypothetical protein